MKPKTIELFSGTREQLDEALLYSGNEGTVILDGSNFDSAICGVTDDGKLVYSYQALVECLMEHDGLTYEDAVEFIEYNTMRAMPYLGDDAPIIFKEIER